MPPIGPHSIFLMVPPVLTLLQTEFCNPVFEGEEPQAALGTEHPPDKDRTSPKSSPDGLGTSLGACMHMPVHRATRSSWCSGSGVVGQVPCRALGLIRGPTSTPGTRGWDTSSQGSASHAGRKQRGGTASSTLALPAFLTFPQVSSSGGRQAGSTVLTASSPGFAWL